MATAAIVPVAAAPAAAAPQAHSSGSVPVTVSTAAATEQASAPITESLKRMPSVGENSPMDKAKLAKHLHYPLQAHGVFAGGQRTVGRWLRGHGARVPGLL